MPLYKVTVREDRVYELTTAAGTPQQALSMAITSVENVRPEPDHTNIDPDNCDVLEISSVTRASNFTEKQQKLLVKLAQRHVWDTSNSEEANLAQEVLALFGQGG